MATLFERHKCKGTLGYDGRTVTVICNLECTPTGSLRIAFNDLPLTRQNAWLLHAVFENDGPLFRNFELTVATAQGEKITSSNVFFTRVGTPISSGRTSLQLEAGAATMVLTIAPAAVETAKGSHTLQYHTVGMLGLGSVRGTCSEGSVLVSGPSKITDYSNVAGRVVFQSEVGDSGSSDWITRCDTRTLSILRMMSLALGRSIDWSVREHFAGDTLECIQFNGPSHNTPPVEPVFHHLNLQPVLDLALANEQRLLDHETGLGEAIDWVVEWHTLAEVRFLSAATAFECLLARYDGKEGGLLPKAVFRDEIRRRLEQTLQGTDVRVAIANSLGSAATDAEVGAILDEMQAKLGNLNQRSFRTRLSRFLSYHDVPLNDLPVTIAELLNMRNQVVHGQTYVSDGSITAYAGMIREALRRSILAMLNFQGQFYSYVRGPEWLPFRAEPET